MGTFRHSEQIWSKFPQLGVVAVAGRINPGFAGAQDELVRLTEVARQRLSTTSEGEFPEIQAWRGAFGSMGLKPTKYRCAAEALVRRLRIQGDLPVVSPLVDYCNAVSVAAALPIAVFDTAGITGDLVVDFSVGDESYLSFAGETETPDSGEVIFRDAARKVHARRWCHRQSALSAAAANTEQVLIVAEAMHADPAPALELIVGELTAAHGPLLADSVRTRRLSRDEPEFRFLD